MLEVQQREMLTYEEQVRALSDDLKLERQTNEEKAEVQHRTFDALNKLESEKAKADEELEDLK